MAKAGTVSFVCTYGLGRTRSFTHVLSAPGSIPRKGSPLPPSQMKTRAKLAWRGTHTVTEHVLNQARVWALGGEDEASALGGAFTSSTLPQGAGSGGRGAALGQALHTHALLASRLLLQQLRGVLSHLFKFQSQKIREPRRASNPA